MLLSFTFLNSQTTDCYNILQGVNKNRPANPTILNLGPVRGYRGLYGCVGSTVWGPRKVLLHERIKFCVKTLYCVFVRHIYGVSSGIYIGQDHKFMFVWDPKANPGGFAV